MTRRMAWVLVVGVFLAVSCSSEGSDDPPTFDRIDGPAVVDPSYDPFAVDPTPAVTGPDGADG